MSKKKPRRPRKIKVEKLLELGKRAAKESYSYGRLFDSPEDASQEYILRLLEGKHRHATVSQAVIDMARDLTGRKNLPHYEEKKALALAIQVDPSKIHGGEHDPSIVAQQRMLIEKLAQELTSTQKGILMFYLRGYNFEEIAKEIGYSMAWVAIQFHEAVAYMKAIANK